MEVVIIGSGNVATVLGNKIAMGGHSILQVCSRSKEHAARLAEELNCPYSTDWTNIDKQAGLYLFCLTDTALPAVAKQLRLPGKLVLHTAGAVSKEVLLRVSIHCGVLYPLQSLRREIRPFPPAPLLVDANRREDLPVIIDFARSISDEVRETDDEARLKLHLGGVLVNNFTNYLYTLTDEFCRKEKIDFKLLEPLIRETGERLSRFSPAEVQTGPAVRGDGKTIKKHLKLLSKYKNIKELYRLFTDKIEEHFTP